MKVISLHLVMCALVLSQFKITFDRKLHNFIVIKKTQLSMNKILCNSVLELQEKKYVSTSLAAQNSQRALQKNAYQTEGVLYRLKISTIFHAWIGLLDAVLKNQHCTSHCTYFKCQKYRFYFVIHRFHKHLMKN